MGPVMVLYLPKGFVTSTTHPHNSANHPSPIMHWEALAQAIRREGLAAPGRPREIRDAASAKLLGITCNTTQSPCLPSLSSDTEYADRHVQLEIPLLTKTQALFPRPYEPLAALFSNWTLSQAIGFIVMISLLSNALTALSLLLTSKTT